MDAKKMKMIRNIIMICTDVFGFVCWLSIPSVFKNSVGFHVGNGEYGMKAGALILLLFPLFALIPDTKDEKEVHSEDPVEGEKIKEEYAMREAKRQVTTAIFLGVTVIAILGIAALVL